MSDAATNPVVLAAPLESPPASPATLPVPPPPPAEEIERVPMGRLSAIEIHNYRAYRGTFRLELPKGENLLVYGENGAGKSSLFHTLRMFMEAPDVWVLDDEVVYQLGMKQPKRPVLLKDHKHRFTTHESSIKLEFGQRVFDWAKGKNDTGHDIVRSLNKGKGFLDYKAAAVYARSALEALCHHTCAKASLPVVHVACPKDRKLEHYIEVLERRLGQLKDEPSRHAANKLIARLREAQAFVLNRNSHFDVEEEDTLSGEVKAAIQTVKDLAEFFEKPQLWRKSNYVDDQTPPAAERMAIELAEARKLARFGPKEDAIQKMTAAHHLAWEMFGLREKVALPIGTPLDAKTIWTAALAQGKLNSAFDARLKAARLYLFGCAKPDEFEIVRFEEAATLLKELCTCQANP